MNYYTILGVPSTATDEEIKHAFRRLARETHPDRNPAPDAAARFALVNEAYAVLSDPQRRQQHDRVLQPVRPMPKVTVRPAPTPPPREPDVPRFMQRSLGSLRELSILFGGFFAVMVVLLLLNGWAAAQGLLFLVRVTYLLLGATVAVGAASPVIWLLLKHRRR